MYSRPRARQNVPKPGNDQRLGDTMRVRHLLGLVNEFFMYSLVNRTWWLLPMMVLMTLMMLLITVGQTAAPYSLYAFF